MILGTIGSVTYGALTPAQFVLMSPVTDDFVDFVQCIKTNCTDPVDLEDSMTTVALWYIGFAVATLISAWAGLGLWGLSAERQIHKMRMAMFRNIIHQEIGWFDTHSSGELGTRLTEYVILLVLDMHVTTTFVLGRDVKRISKFQFRKYVIQKW